MTKIASFLSSPIWAILKHKQVDFMKRKMLFTIFKYLFSFQRYSSFSNMQISQVMTSYTQPDFVLIWWKEISQPIWRVVHYTQRDSNGIVLNPLVFHWWNASHYGDFEYFLWLQAEWGCILLVHWYDWYDWYQWNNTYSIGILLVKCILLRGLKIFPLASG